MQFEWDFSWKILSKEMKDFLRKHTHWTELWNTLDFLEWKWLRHNDLHPWNIMIDNKGNTNVSIQAYFMMKKVKPWQNTKAKDHNKISFLLFNPKNRIKHPSNK